VAVTIKSMVNSDVPVTDAAIEELVLRCPKVESLALINCTALTPKAIQTIARGYGPQLVSLSVEGCVGALTNATIQTHFAPLAPLQHLSLEGCWKITNEGIKVLSQTCRGLKTIKLSGCYKLSDDALKFLSDNCYGMEKWRLARLPAISNNGLEYIAHLRGTSLRILDVSACPVGNEGIAAILSGCPRLEELSVKHCKRLSNPPFLEHIVNCTNLVTLDVQRLNLDNDGVKAIITACPNLRVANFKCANHLDPALLATIPLHCPDLEVLRLYGDGVDKDLFINISANCKRLHTLDLRRLKLPFEEVEVIGSSDSACKRSRRRLCIVEANLTTEHIAWFQAQFPLATVLWQKKKRPPQQPPRRASSS